MRKPMYLLRRTAKNCGHRLLLQFSRKVDHDCHGRRRHVADEHIHEKTLAVRRNAVLVAAPSKAVMEARSKQRAWLAGLERRRRTDGDRHQGVVRCQVEQFLSVAAPDRLTPAVRRNLTGAAVAVKTA